MKPGHITAAALAVLACLAAANGASPAAAAISAVWANDGADKVTREELRVGNPNGRKVINRIWDGNKISISGARNEVLSFNLVIESATQTAAGVAVTFDTLAGPGGALIQSTPAVANGVFNWVDRPIELFFVRYLQIKGLSQLGYENYYDERHVPERLRRPWTGNGAALPGTTWQDRPDHDASYPDIAVPLELVPTFDVAAGTNQSVWADIYVPHTTAPGLYLGQVTITETGSPPRIIPVELTVYDFALPDVPTAKTMLFYSAENVNERYLGQTWIVGPDEARAKLIQDRHFLLAHRHKVHMIGDDSGIDSDYTAEDRPGANFAARLQGGFFTAANGYGGPGTNVANDVYSVKTYGSWSSSWGKKKASMWQRADGWAGWFDLNAPGTETFLYLIDESTNYSQTEKWAQWLAGNPGPGRGLKSMATLSLPAAVTSAPTLQVVASVASFGVPESWEDAAALYSSDPARRFYLYNGVRPGSGSFMTEDDGVALRANGWIQFKKRINRWFYWESTYYSDFQGGSGKQDLFQSAHTFGTYSSNDSVQGETGWNYSNGDGVLMYPGTDVLFPANSYAVDGPFASLRMKHWRRGLQDHDYLTLASQIDPAAVQSIVASVIPSVVWEVGVDELADPTYVHANISWSTDADVWDAARAQLAQIITTAVLAPLSVTTPSPLPVATVGLAYSATIAGSGGLGPFTWAVVSGSLPPGMTLIPARGEIAGTPTTAGAATFSVTVSDNSGRSAARTFDLAVTAPVEAPLSVTKLRATLNFAKPARDSYRLTATLGLGGPNVDLSGKVLVIEVGGVQTAFALSTTGGTRGIAANGSCRLAWDQRLGLWVLNARVSRGTWASAWNDHGLVNAAIPQPGVPITLPARVRFESSFFAGSRSSTYTASLDRSGTAR